MTDSPWDGDSSDHRWNDPKAIAARTRNVVRARNLSLVALAATVIAVWILYHQPAHSYPVGANATTWSADVTTALAKRPSGGNFVPTGALRNLPGVGRVFEVVVDQEPSLKGKMVMFLTKVDADGAGLTRCVWTRFDRLDVALAGLQLTLVEISGPDLARAFGIPGHGTRSRQRRDARPHSCRPL